MKTGAAVVITKGFYFHKECKVAGVVDSVSLRDEEVLLAMRLSGTSDEGCFAFTSAAKSALKRRPPRTCFTHFS
jgi:hypothetical protein